MILSLQKREKRSLPSISVRGKLIKKKKVTSDFLFLSSWVENTWVIVHCYLSIYFLKICTVLKYYWDWKPVNVLVHLHFDQNHSVPITYFLFFLIFFLSKLSVAVSFASHVKFKHQSLKFTIKFKEVF